jgi:hypothetical protein
MIEARTARSPDRTFICGQMAQTGSSIVAVLELDGDLAALAGRGRKIRTPLQQGPRPSALR